MLRSMARSKVTWGVVVTTLVVGLALLLMLTSQSIHPQPAQAQSQPVTVTQLRFDGENTRTYAERKSATLEI